MRALKVRNIFGIYCALSELKNFLSFGQGRRAFASLSACPWLPYFAPLALRSLIDKTGRS
jgi:hypothetical protein